MKVKGHILHKNRKIFLIISLSVLTWFLAYHFPEPGDNRLVDLVFRMETGTPPTEAVRFFLNEFPEVMKLTVLFN